MKAPSSLVSVKITRRPPPPESAPQIFRPTRGCRTTVPGLHFSGSKAGSIRNPAWSHEFFREEKWECGCREETFHACKDCGPPCNPGNRCGWRNSSAKCCLSQERRIRRCTCRLA